MQIHPRIKQRREAVQAKKAPYLVGSVELYSDGEMEVRLHHSINTVPRMRTLRRMYEQGWGIMMSIFTDGPMPLNPAS